MRDNYVHGSASIQQFFNWINERQAIWWRRSKGHPKPWTTDPVMLDYKFTNCFRELDAGTVALRLMECGHIDKPLLIWNAWWYRLFNWHEHATKLGFIFHYNTLEEYMLDLHKRDGRIFTGAHMVRGLNGERKVFSYLRLAKQLYEERDAIYQQVKLAGTIEGAYNVCLGYYLMGDFTSYEVACDMRWTVLRDAPDKLTWANPGNGAIRGLKRLGLSPTLAGMIQIFEMKDYYLAYWVKNAPVPFELREIEHSLCEFDKYERVRTGQGRPRSKYNGRI